MLDQRRAKKQGYITLKEAAEIANYTPDYVGQLIRAGKIKGEQVYSSVAWVTTEDEVRAYLSDKARVVGSSKQQTAAQQSFPYVSYAAVAAFAILTLLMQYVLFVSLDTKIEKAYAQKADTVTMHIVR